MVETAAEELALLQRADYLGCKNNAATFIARHCKIETPTGEAIKFNLWDCQHQTVTAMGGENPTIILKARRMGLSWLALSYALWLAIMQPGSRILMLCKRLDDSKEMVGRIRRMLARIETDPASRHLISGLTIGRDSVDTLQIGESVFRALPATERSARQETSALLIMDEFAFCDNAPDIMRAALPTIEGGGKAIIISTGNGQTGKGAEFAQQWSRARSGESGWQSLFFPWQARPDRDEAWKKKTIAALGDPDRFRVEYPEKESDAFLSPDTFLVYPPAGIDAAERLGREIQSLIDAGQLEPKGATMHVGIDWGEYTHALPVWELEGGGLYIPPKEIVAHSQDPVATSNQILNALSTFDYPLQDARYDAAGVQSMHTFMTNAPKGSVRVKVRFNEFKTLTIKYLRRLFQRAADGETTGVIAIHPDNKELLRQLRQLEFQDLENEKVKKGDDHGPDALIAAAAPIAHIHRKIQEKSISG